MKKKHKRGDLVYHVVYGYMIVYENNGMLNCYHLDMGTVLRQTIESNCLRLVDSPEEQEEVEEMYGVREIINSRKTTPPRKQSDLHKTTPGQKKPKKRNHSP